MMVRRRSVCVVALSLLLGTGCGPTEPKVDYVTLASVRYVRTLPVIAPSTLMVLGYSIPRPDDPRKRPSLGSVLLRAVDEVTFVYDYPQTIRVAVGHTNTFYVIDTAVSPYYVATDVFVNSTKIIDVDKSGDYQYARFKVDASGRVYFD